MISLMLLAGIGGIQGIVQRNLFCHGQLATTAACGVQTEPAAVIRAPLAAGAIRTGMFFRSFVRHGI